MHCSISSAAVDYKFEGCLELTILSKILKDLKGYHLSLFDSQWNISLHQMEKVGGKGTTLPGGIKDAPGAWLQTSVLGSGDAGGKFACHPSPVLQELSPRFSPSPQSPNPVTKHLKFTLLQFLWGFHLLVSNSFQSGSCCWGNSFESAGNFGCGRRREKEHKSTLETQW